MKLILIFLAAIAFLFGCSSIKTNDKKSDSLQAGTQNTHEAPREITLTEMHSDKMGFSIEVPAEAKELQNDGLNWTYSTLLYDGKNTIHVTVHKAISPVRTMVDAANYANVIGENESKVLQQIGDDFLVVKEATTHQQEFWYFEKAAKGYFVVKCVAPPMYEEICLRIVQSLKADAVM